MSYWRKMLNNCSRKSAKIYYTVYGYVKITSIPFQPVNFANTHYIPKDLIPTADFYRVLKILPIPPLFKFRLILILCLWYSARKSSWLLIIILQSPIIYMFTRKTLLFLFSSVSSLNNFHQPSFICLILWDRYQKLSSTATVWRVYLVGTKY